jgi:DNA-binding XRE family transcriptional regulator
MKKTSDSPIGRKAADAAKDRGRRSPEYRNAREEYARIRELRKVNPVAAHLRARRFELDLTQKEVAEAAGTSHTAISRMESEGHLPKLDTLQRITRVLDEELTLCFEHKDETGEVEREYAALPVAVA